MPKLVEWTRALNCITWWDLVGSPHLKWLMESSWMALSTTTRLEISLLWKGNCKVTCKLSYDAAGWKGSRDFQYYARGRLPDEYRATLIGMTNQESQLSWWHQRFHVSMHVSCSQLPEVLYTTLIKGFARAGQVDQAVQVYDEMRKEPQRWKGKWCQGGPRFLRNFEERSMQPDVITFSILIKANCDVGRPKFFWSLLVEYCDWKRALLFHFPKF